MLLQKIVLPLLLTYSNQVSSQKIAIIGGGISGSFTAKYLADYDVNCTLNSITIFDPVSPSSSMDPEREPDDDWQGSRVASVRLDDGSIVEVGASIAYKGFYHVIEMIQDDSSLEMGPPFNTGSNSMDPKRRSGLGIFDGSQSWKLLTSGYSSIIASFLMIWRYNYDLLKMDRFCKQALKSFAKFPSTLKSLEADTFFESPDALWDSASLTPAVHNSFDALLDEIGIPEDLPWYRRYLPYQGSLRKELLTAVNLVNYNQDNSEVNGMVGLGSFAATAGGLFSIVGGNYQVIQSAKYQATQASLTHCNGNVQIEQIPKKVTDVVGGSASKLQLYSDQDDLGEFDIVIVATALQHSRIKFSVQSHVDENVLQPMPLAGMVNSDISSNEGGDFSLPRPLPDSAVRPYTQVVTTVVENGTLSADAFGLLEQDLPRSIMLTRRGKSTLHNITAITQIASDGLYKMFSNEKLSGQVLTDLFGPHHNVAYVKKWGGPHGGATPSYQGQAGSLGFVLYDGAVGFEGHTTSGAVYYPNAMEQNTLSCMEICAIGAKAVSKLIARRLGFIQPAQSSKFHDEL